MHRSLRIAVTLGILVVVLALLSSAVLAQSPLTIPLEPLNNSGESGTATLTDLGNGKVRVDVTITGAPAGVAQPMHLHEGTCANLNPAPAFPLNNLENGTSSTEISTTIEALLASPYALNGHKSAEEASVYVFCGDVVETAAQATSEATGTVTGEATMGATAEATGTAEATSAATEQATATTEATTALTAGATATPAATLPATGAPAATDVLIPLVLLGGALLVVGWSLRRGLR